MGNERKPSIAEVRQWLDVRNPLALSGAEVGVVSERNHLIYHVTKGERVYALRLINPESYRRGEWISMTEEFEILKAIEPTGLGPRAYAFEWGAPYMTQPLSFMIQEFVEAACFNGLKPLTEEHLVGAAWAIALLNQQPISPERFPFMRKYVHEGFQRAKLAGYFRLVDSFRRLPRRDVLQWAVRIMPIVRKTSHLLTKAEYLLPSEFSFHFDGAHTGNTYWRDGRTVFLDWQKISLRNDPSFTLVRFATSVGEKGVVPERVWETLVNSYLDVRPDAPNFPELAWVRLLERQTADLVWVLWDYARRGDRRPVEQGTSVVPRYAAVQQMLLQYG